MATSPASSSSAEAAPDVLVQVLEILEDTHDDLKTCGPAVTSLLSRLFNLINTALGPPSYSLARSTQLKDSTTLASSLLRLADEKLNSFPYRDVPRCWRRLYTDATLLGAIAQLAGAEEMGTKEEKKELEETVKKLDLAIVIAGAPGEGREELVFALMEVAQGRLRATTAPTTSPSSPPRKKRRLSPSSASEPLPPPYIYRPFPEPSSLPSRLDLPCPSSSAPPAPFSPSHPHCSPFVVRAAASPSTGWPAVDRWRDLGYLQEQAGPGRVVPVEVGGDYTKEGWGQRLMPFDEFLNSLSPPPASSSPSCTATDATPPPPPIYYLAQHSLFRQFPSLLSDFSVPDLVYSAPSTDGAGGAYEGVQNEEGYVVNAWFGPGGTKSAAHQDPWWNCYVQVTGSKWVWVAPPSCAASMAAFGSSASPDPSSPTSPSSVNAAETAKGAGASDKAEQYMTNTSSLDVTVPPPLPSASSSPALPTAPPGSTPAGPAPRDEVEEKTAYYPPDWLANVEPLSRQVVLGPGDVLVMPPRWWHAMQSLETSFSVSIWF